MGETTRFGPKRPGTTGSWNDALWELSWHVVCGKTQGGRFVGSGLDGRFWRASLFNFELQIFMIDT